MQSWLGLPAGCKKKTCQDVLYYRIECSRRFCKYLPIIMFKLNGNRSRNYNCDQATIIRIRAPKEQSKADGVIQYIIQRTLIGQDNIMDVYRVYQMMVQQSKRNGFRSL